MLALFALASAGPSACVLDVTLTAQAAAADEGDTGGDELGGELGHDSGAPHEPGPGPGPEPHEPPLYCQVGPGSIDGPPPCETQWRSGQSCELDFHPELARAWVGPEGEHSVLTTPLVLNFDDDNHDGVIDLCDRPDLIVVAAELPKEPTHLLSPGHVYVIDGETLTTRLRSPYPVDPTVTPAVADIDGDGDPELVTLESKAATPGAPRLRRLVILDHAGQMVGLGDEWHPSKGGGAVAIADLDRDGEPELLAPDFVADTHGTTLWLPTSTPEADSSPVAIDLDLDGAQEVLFGGSAYAFDGALRFHASPANPNGGHAAVANFDADPFPELYLQLDDHRVFEHDGSEKAHCSSGDRSHAAIADLDGDGMAEILYGYHDRFELLAVEGDTCSKELSILVDEGDARSSGTAFDLLDDGHAEMIYADRSRLRIFALDGSVRFESPRSARASSANPVIADIDNDGAAELVVVSSVPYAGDLHPDIELTPTLMVFENQPGGFAPTRRIWNQHAYHAGSITEDGRLPGLELPTWRAELGFRTNPPPEDASGMCQPPLIE